MFPLMIMLLVPVRQYILPKFFKGAHLYDLDAAEYEEAPSLPYNLATETELGHGASNPGDREILDEVITRSRGEFRHTCSPRITSSTATPANDMRGHQSPRLSCQSPRLKGERSPRASGKGSRSHSPRTGELKPSNLGRSPLNPGSY
ncbi:hypothetical protein F3Y22_tig00111398pilonHSYRG00162 [Hibiscus syriacus]|uniref:Uncharacterized protein n=2 Tax=Hibiscus syriacus TaxID=106335 RepID=A0A6A2Y5Q2_HIBSY|nr:hypothetical protein F3Y22_tig00111398pilonHSYRG00162 [Hibiscus syriacus]